VKKSAYVGCQVGVAPPLKGNQCWCKSEGDIEFGKNIYTKLVIFFSLNSFKVGQHGYKLKVTKEPVLTALCRFCGSALKIRKSVQNSNSVQR